MATDFTRRSLLKTGGVAAGALAAGAALAPLVRHTPRRNIILVVADAMRADAVGGRREVDGRTQSLTPFVESLARSGVSFGGAVAPSSWTPVSMGGILYGAPAPTVFYEGEDLVTGQSGEGLQHELSGAGYYTAAVVANEVLDVPHIRSGFAHFKGYAEGAEARYMNRMSGFPFEEVKIHAARVNTRVSRLVGKLASSRSFFLYVHYMDTHEPYFAPKKLLESMGWKDKRIFTGRMRNSYHWGLDEVREGLSFEEGMRGLRAGYDSAVMFTDRMFSRLFERLRSHGLLDDTMVIFTSDHGEEFIDGEIEEERTLGHALNLSQPTLHVPLVMWAPPAALPGGLLVPESVSSAEAIRAAVRWFAADAKAAGFDGVLAHLAPGRRGILSALNFNGYNGASWIEGDTKVVMRLDDGGGTLYRRAFRVGGSAGAAHIPVPAALAAKLDRAIEDAGTRRFDPDALDESLRRRLKALGYLN